MKKRYFSLLLLFCLSMFLIGCYEYGPPPSGYVGPAPDDRHHRHDRGYEAPSSPEGAVGPAPRHDYRDYPDNPPSPEGAVGPAGRRY
ncbi:MAG: hypothetical protein EPN25_04655 [Nitrospirae bacterium]|nr:MAG: hypothetical protein EPN25_04655 [Nitrospirota bacterium]